MRLLVQAILLLAALAPLDAAAQGINTSVALPVAAGEGIWRSQIRYLRATDDPSPMDREVRTWLLPQTLVYGITPRLTAFATLPLLAARQFEAANGSVRRDEAVGDLTLLGRAMLFVDDYAPLSTRRVAGLAGLRLPIGADRFGTQTFDPIAGLVATWAADRHELDVDALYTLGTARHGRDTADTFRYDAAYRYRLWPTRFAGRTLQLNAVIEWNGSWTGRFRLDGETLRASGGHLAFVSPGLQLAAVQWIVEASLQLPVVQDLNGPQIETDLVAVLSVRVPFDLGW